MSQPEIGLSFGLFQKNAKDSLEAVSQDCIVFDGNNKLKWIENLTIGKTYWLSVSYSNKTLIKFCLLTNQNEPINDEISNAVLVVPNPSYTCINAIKGTLNHASPSKQGIDFVCDSLSKGDVWYKFVAKSTTHSLKISFEPNPSQVDTATQISAFTFDSITGKYTQKICSNNVNELNAIDFVIGTTYYIKIAGNQQTAQKVDFSLCIYTGESYQINNGECVDAIQLNVQNPNVCDSTIYSMQGGLSFDNQSACGVIYKDVWFKFVATDTIHNIFINSISTAVSGATSNYVEKNLSFDLFQSEDCDNLQQPTRCYSTPSILRSLEIGKTYYIKVNWNGNGFNNPKFTFCVQKVVVQIPTNDVCAGAKTIPISPSIGTKIYLKDSNKFALTNLSPLTKDICNSDSAKYLDMWYKFVATKTEHLVYLFDINTPLINNLSYNLYLEIYKGNCNTGFTAINCAGEVSYLLSNLNVGETYYVRTYTNQNRSYSPFEYKVAVSETNAVISSCNNATPLASGQKYEFSTLRPVTKTVWQNNGSKPYSAQVWYKFKANNTSIFYTEHDIVNISPSGLNDAFFNVYLLKGACADSNMVIDRELLHSSKERQRIEGLEKDSTYYIVFSGSDKLRFIGNFSIEQGAPQAPNKDCAAATLIPVNSGLVPVNVIKDSIDMNFSNDDTKFHKFVATQRQHIIHLKTISQTFSGNVEVFDVRKGDCNSTENATTLNSDKWLYLPNLEIGETYIIHTQNSGSDADKKIYEIAILTFDTLATNDECFNSLALDAITSNSSLCINTQNIVLKHATLDTTSSYSYYVFGALQWFHFTAKSEQHTFKISHFIDKKNDSNAKLIAILFDENTCLKPKEKQYVEFNFGDKDSSEVRFDELIVGKTYKLAMSKGGINSNCRFDACIIAAPAPPINNDCANAIDLPTNGNVVSGTLKNATFKNELLSTCVFNPQQDVWYSFTATATRQLMFFKKVDETYAVVELFTQGCTSGQSGTCLSIADTLSFINNLVIGQKYYLSVRTNYVDANLDYSFKIALSNIQPISYNDACLQANNIPVSAASTVSQYVQSDFLYNNVLWYKFKATATKHRVQIVSLSSTIKNEAGSYSPITAQVTEGASCDTIDPIVQATLFNNYLSNPLDSTSSQNIVNGLVIGKTYRILVTDNRGYGYLTSTPFKIGVCAAEAPENQTTTLAKALPINGNTNFVNALSEDSKNTNMRPHYYGPNYENGLLYYKFTATAIRHQLMLKDLKTDVGYNPSVIYRLYDTNLNIVKQGPLPSFMSDNEIIGNLTIGDNYIVELTLEKRRIVASNIPINNVDMTFKIGLITHPNSPINDNCDAAIVVPINTTPQCQQVIKGSTAFATNPYNVTNGDDDNVWYKFTATAERYFIQLKNIIPVKGDVIDMEYKIIEEDNSVPCEFANPIGNSSNRFFPLAPWTLTVGKTYYISVYTKYLNGLSRCEFDLCISSPIANDDVKGAVLASNTLAASSGAKSAGACTNAVTASSIGATYSFDAGLPVGACNIGILPKDIWFKTVVGSKPNLAIQIMKSPQGADVQMVAYKLQKGKLLFLSSTCPVDTLRNLIAGDTIALRVWDGTGTAFGDYTLCVQSFAKTTATGEPCSGCVGVNIHPVPTSDYLNINVNFVSNQKINIMVLNVATGQIVIQKAAQNDIGTGISEALDVRSLPSGTYILMLNDGNQTYKKTFLKI